MSDKKTPRVEVRTLDDLRSDPNNINKHTIRGHQIVENSLRKRGAFRSVAAAGKGTDKPMIYAGGLTTEKARDAGITEAIFVHTTGDQLVVVVRDDVTPESPEAIALGIEDNESARQSYAPDVDIVAALSLGDDAILKAVQESDGVFSSLIDDITRRQSILGLDSSNDDVDGFADSPQVKQGEYLLIVNMDGCDDEQREFLLNYVKENDIKYKVNRK